VTRSRFVLVLMAMVVGEGAPAGSDGEVVLGRYTYSVQPTTNPYIRPRPGSATGVVTAIDRAAGTITLRSIHTPRVHQPPKGEKMLLRPARDCRLFVDNRPQDIGTLKAGDVVHAWLEGADGRAKSPATQTAGSLYRLRGVSTSEQWFPEILLKPDAAGCVFFDDFETGDLRRWHYRAGCVGILQRGAPHGTYAFTATRPDQEGVAADLVYLYGLPQMDDIWMTWTFLHTGQPADSGSYAIFRPFPAAGAQLFAVRIVAPRRAGQGQWRLACQLAESPAIRGRINLSPNRIHTIKLHWVKATRPGAADGTVETWIDGTKDIDRVGTATTWTAHQLARLAMGVLHTGTKRFGATVVIDDIWIGDRDPDAPAKKEHGRAPIDTD